MRVALLLAILLLISIPLPSQLGFCPATPEIGELRSEHYFEGSIGRRSVRAYLARGDKATVGTFYYTDDWAPHLLRGTWAKGDLLQLTDTTEKSSGTGNLQAHIGATNLVGTWIPLGTSSKLPVRLKEIARPDCEAKNEKWVRFDDPRWPITFSYPASWHLDVGAHGITIRCPDPSLMAYSDFNISVIQGTSTKEDLPMTRCGDKWYSPTCDCEDLTGVFCDRPADATQRGAITTINGDRREWRGYCLEGGYSGQADGTDRILLVGDKWVEFTGQGEPSALIERIAETTTRR